MGRPRGPREHRTPFRRVMSVSSGSALGTAAPGQYWWLPFAAGLLTITVGLIALIWPGPTLLVVGVLFGAYLMVWGVVSLVRGIGGGDGMGPGAPACAGGPRGPAGAPAA